MSRIVNPDLRPATLRNDQLAAGGPFDRYKDYLLTDDGRRYNRVYNAKINSDEWIEEKNMFNGIEAIKGERESQPGRGYTKEHDAKHTGNELIYAAEAHLAAAEGSIDEAMELWPVAWDWSKLHINTPVSSLAKAGALIAAEIDRRIAAGECKETDFGHPFPKEM